MAMKVSAVVALLLVCMLVSVNGVNLLKALKKDTAQHALHEGSFKNTVATKVATKDTTTSVAATAVQQLSVSTDLVSLTTEIAAGLVSKSTTVMIAWQAAESSTEIVKEIHSLAGGEAGVTTGRTWVYNVTGFTDLSTWMTTYADELAAHGTYSSTAGTVSWVIEASPVDEPSNVTCQAFATAIGNGDLAAALVIASFTYTQDLEIDSNVLAAQVALQTGGSLIAERYDSSCLGYKFFNYYDAPTQWGTTTTVTPTFTD